MEKWEKGQGKLDGSNLKSSYVDEEKNQHYIIIVPVLFLLLPTTNTTITATDTINSIFCSLVTQKSPLCTPLPNRHIGFEVLKLFDG